MYVHIEWNIIQPQKGGNYAICDNMNFAYFYASMLEREAYQYSYLTRF